MNQKHVFWEALILAVFIFASGIFVGYLVEQNRTGKIITAYQEADLNLLDIQIQESVLSVGDFDCELAVKETINFADRTFQQASTLDEYEQSARLTEGIVFQHKKYDLLRTILWSNSLLLKKRCNSSFHTVVYFYEYDSEDVGIVAKQESFSRFLEELKKEKGEDVILIPIAGNLDINSVNFLKKSYGVGDLPTILIDEEHVITELNELMDIEKYL